LQSTVDLGDYVIGDVGHGFVQLHGPGALDSDVSVRDGHRAVLVGVVLLQGIGVVAPSASFSDLRADGGH